MVFLFWSQTYCHPVCRYYFGFSVCTPQELYTGSSQKLKLKENETTCLLKHVCPVEGVGHQWSILTHVEILRKLIAWIFREDKKILKSFVDILHSCLSKF